MNNIELIDKYFENSLTPKEQSSFNDLLQNDKEFKKEFLFQKDIQKVIAINRREELKLDLQQFEKEFQEKSKGAFFNKWLIAASLALLIGFGIWFVKDSYFPTNEQLYTQNFEPYRNIVQPIVRGESSKTIKYSAFVAYENKNYHKAINLFNSIANPNETPIQFYKAMCFLSLSKTDDAIQTLLPIAASKEIESSSKNYTEMANWYLGLAYLKNDDLDKALSQFSIIANHPDYTFKKEEAKKIITFIE
ncbi:MAG: hypothetical protein J7K34_03135 [Flavobacteriaceae bacterium]|nr:hypothetical protein [Flavobacteriaceae bacterium]